jgi:uncharacterized membrane protein YphA (DoxX/SURF4 family)
MKTNKLMHIAGWTLTILLGALLTMSAFMKITQDESAVAQAATIGIDAATYRLVGIVEIVALILFMIPRTGILGTLLLIAYMGGAIITHLQHQQPVVIAVTVQVILWISATLRFPELRQRLLSGKINYYPN